MGTAKLESERVDDLKFHFTTAPQSGRMEILKALLDFELGQWHPTQGRSFSIVGTRPNVSWHPNPDGAIRSEGEIIEIARRWGVTVPDYILFSVDKKGKYLDENTTAKTTTFRELEGTIIWPKNFYHRLTNKIPFWIRKDVLESDEAIVAVVGHEMFELDRLFTTFRDGAEIEKWEAETSPNNPGNIHSQAWDYADRLVESMRLKSS